MAGRLQSAIRVSIQATASALAAALDLKLVTSIRGAMRAADAASGKTFPVAWIGPAPDCFVPRFLPRLLIEPTPRFLPRPVIQPTRRFLARPVIHPTPRFEPRQTIAPAEPEQPCRCGVGLPPPWKTHIWKMPITPKATIKQVVHRTDVQHKGSLLDLFI